MKKQGPDFEEFSPGQSPLSCEARVLDLVDLSSRAVSSFEGVMETRPFGYRILRAVSCWVATTLSLLSQGPLGGPPWDLPPLEAGNCPLPGRVQLSLLQEVSLD